MPDTLTDHELSRAALFAASKRLSEWNPLEGVDCESLAPEAARLVLRLCQLAVDLSRMHDHELRERQHYAEMANLWRAIQTTLERPDQPLLNLLREHQVSTPRGLCALMKAIALWSSKHGLKTVSPATWALDA